MPVRVLAKKKQSILSRILTFLLFELPNHWYFGLECKDGKQKTTQFSGASVTFEMGPAGLYDKHHKVSSFL